MNQPACAKCASPLPWADVDRGFGSCKSCGLTFDFSVPASATMPAAGAIPGSVTPGMPDALGPQRIPLPSIRIARPSEVQLSDGPDGFSIGWNMFGMRERMVVAVAFAAFAIVLWSLYSKDLVAAGLFTVLGIVAAFTALRARHAGGGLALKGPILSSLQGPEVPVADIASIHCEEPAIGKGVSIIATLRDQRTVALVTDLDERAIAVFVAQVLVEKFVSSPSRSKT